MGIAGAKLLWVHAYGLFSENSIYLETLLLLAQGASQIWK